VCHKDNFVEYQSIYVSQFDASMQRRPSMKYCKRSDPNDCVLFPHTSGSTSDVASKNYHYDYYYNFNGEMSSEPYEVHELSFIDPLSLASGISEDALEACVVAPGREEKDFEFNFILCKDATLYQLLLLEGIKI